jgi:hypothetical protein
MIPIQSKDVEEKILLRNWKRQEAIDHMKQRVNIVEVVEATELDGRHIFTSMAPPK